MDKPAFDQAVQDHERDIKAAGLEIWVGAEPTFTDRYSEEAEWLNEANGSTKQLRALGTLADLHRGLNANAVVLRTLGRQYNGEVHPRWNMGLYYHRDGHPIWAGPPDPLLQGSNYPGLKPIPTRAACVRQFRDALHEQLIGKGWNAISFDIEQAPGLRLAFRCDAEEIAAHPITDQHLTRSSIHSRAVPIDGLNDELAQDGTFLIAIDGLLTKEETILENAAWLELPAFPNVHLFEQFLTATTRAAAAAGLNGLVLTGFPPPVDHSVSWWTITPDPGVVEVNMAPAPDLQTFYSWNRTLFRIAEQQGLSAYRLNYNGYVSDSGGGGQITLGGPAPESSPFFLAPHLLPNLIRYFNQHPAFSYYFAPDSIGSFSQSPRPDEKVRESFAEMEVALEQLSRIDSPNPEILWSSLAPFLVDPSGNTHRSEINIEKLWNPFIPSRGQLGLVEFRAFRMPRTPERLTALAALLRAIAAYLAGQQLTAGLKDWGSELHDRFALPYYLEQDLKIVLDDLAQAGLGLGKPLVEQIFLDDGRLIGQAKFEQCRIMFKHAIEFWPVLGDIATQQSGGSRWMDASTHRIEVTMRCLSNSRDDLDKYQLTVNGCRVPMRLEQDDQGPLLIFGIRYRSFVPWRGLHPTLGAQNSLKFILSKTDGRHAMCITLYDWHPDGSAYDGLPQDFTEARKRREERFVVQQIEVNLMDSSKSPPEPALSPFCLDLRRI
jgi:uncharacterized protein (DUF2126 family)